MPTWPSVQGMPQIQISPFLVDLSALPTSLTILLLEFGIEIGWAMGVTKLGVSYCYVNHVVVVLIKKLEGFLELCNFLLVKLFIHCNILIISFKLKITFIYLSFFWFSSKPKEYQLSIRQPFLLFPSLTVSNSHHQHCFLQQQLLQSILHFRSFLVASTGFCWLSPFIFIFSMYFILNFRFKFIVHHSLIFPQNPSFQTHWQKSTSPDETLLLW